LSKRQEIRAKIDKLDDLLRLASDLRRVLDFRNRVEETGGVVDLVVFATGERVFTRLSSEDLATIDTRIAKMIDDLITKANKLVT